MSAVAPVALALSSRIRRVGEVPCNAVHVRLDQVPFPAEWRSDIHSWWIFSSRSGLPAQDGRVIAPNGRAKLIFTVRGELSLRAGTTVERFAEGAAWLVGPWDEPCSLGSPPAETVTVGIELLPASLRHVVNVPAASLRNTVIPAELAGPWWRNVDGIDSGSAQRVVASVRGILATAFSRPTGDRWLAAWATDVIRTRSGGVTVDELARASGYSERMLRLAFERDVGLSPKLLAQIERFQSLYVDWARFGAIPLTKVELFSDVSHLTREFKRFAGAAPREFESSSNEFGRLFYLRQPS